MKHRVITIPTVSLLLAILAIGGFAHADPINETKLAKVKSAYLLNFIRFASWPNRLETQNDKPVILGVLGRDNLGNILDLTVRKQTVQGRPIIVRRYPCPWPEGVDAKNLQPSQIKTIDAFRESLKDCHLLFVSRSEGDHYQEMLGLIASDPVLTVSDIPQFASRGGMIGLAIHNQRLIFEINPDRLKEAGLSISSKLLKLAQIVGSGEERRQ